MEQQSEKCRPLEIVREKTDKLRSSLDNFRIMFRGYNKMRSRILPKGVSMLMASNNQDEEDEGPFKRGGIRGGIRNSHRRVSCPEEDVLAGTLRGTEEEYSSLPPISLNFDHDNRRKVEGETNKKKASRLRSNSLFEFLNKKESNKGETTEHRHSLPSSTDDQPTPKPKSLKFIPKAEKRHIKRIPKGTFTSTETGAILPSVLLTYQSSVCHLPAGCNEYDYYLQSNQLEGIKA